MTSRPFSAFPKEGLQFLRSLKRHNNREWFQKHKSTYEDSVKKPMERLVEALAAELSAFAPEMLASPKTSIYRIYRDTRFSQDKSPYKTHAAAVFSRKGLGKHEGAGFYLHLAPQELLIGGGVYMPLPEDLHAIRSYIAGNLSEFEAILAAKSFRRLFGTLSGDQLTRVPKGFSANDPAAAFLRYKQFLAGRTLEPEQALDPGFFKIVVSSFRGLLPLIRFLNEPLVQARRIKDRQQAVLGA